MKVYEIFVKFMNDKFAEKPEQPETTINADDTDDNTDDLRAETIKRYQSTIENNTNIYFDVEDWHIILDHLEAKQDDKKGNIAIEAALTQHPNHPVLLTRKAKKEVDKGDYKKALELINQAEQQEEKHHPNLYYVKANIYGLLGSADLSIPLYKKLASQKGEELKWWRTHSYDCLIEIYCEQKNYPECIRLSKEAIEERTDDEILYSNLALYHALNNNPEEAEKVCNQFIKKHPDSSTCIARLGHTYVQTKQYDKAIQSFNTAYNMDNEENYGTLYYKGNVLLQLEKYEDALVCFELCLMYYKLSPDYHIAAAQCYEKLNFPKLAINHYRAALAINPDSTEALAAMKLLTNDSTPLSKYN